MIQKRSAVIKRIITILTVLVLTVAACATGCPASQPEQPNLTSKSITRKIPALTGEKPPYIKIKPLREGTLIQWGTPEGANVFCVYRKTGLYGSWEFLAQTDEPTYIDDGAGQKGFTYYYMVEAYHTDDKPAGELQSRYSKYALKIEDGDAIKVEEPCKVLMIGNSMTAYYGNSAVEDIRQMAELNGDAMDITQLLINNAVLYDYAYGAYSGYLANALSDTKYDVIVLQEESWTTCSNTMTYLYYIDCITDVLEAYGQQDARLILYAVNGCTHKWGVSYGNYERNMLVNVTLAAQRIQERHSFREVLVAKAGELHMQARIATPWMGFLSYDGNHPDWYGFYLSAMRLYSAITERPLKATAQEMMPYVDLSNMELQISQEEASLSVGETLQLSVSNAEKNTLYWSSYNPEVASVTENGLVQAVSEGKAAILVETNEGLQQICIIDVSVDKS